MASGVYCIRHIESGRCYVGQAQNLKRRWREHRSSWTKGTHKNIKLQNGVNKYGEKAFIFEVLEYVPCLSDLNAREQHFMDTMRPFYNISPIAGSSRGVKRTHAFRMKMSKVAREREFTPETRKRMSISQRQRKAATPETRKKLSDAKYNLTLETRRKLSRAQRGKTYTIAARAKMSASARARRKKHGGDVDGQLLFPFE